MSVRVDGPQRVVVEAELAGRGHAQVVVHDVGPGDEGFERGPGGRGLQIERHPAFAPLAGGEDALDVAHLVTGGRLHLDHVRSQIGHQHRAERSGQEVAEVEDAQSLQREAGRRRPAGRVRRGRGRGRGRVRWAGAGRQLAEDLFGVLAQGRGGPGHPRGRRGGEGGSRLDHPTVLVVDHLGDVAVRPCLLVGQDGAVLGGRLRRNVMGPEVLEPLAEGRVRNATRLAPWLG